MSPQHAAGPMYESYATVFSHSRSSEHPQYAVTPITRHVPLPTRTPYQNGNRIVDYQQESQYSPSPRVIASSLPASSFVVPSQYPSRLSYTPAPPAEANYSISSPLSPTQPASPWYDSRPDYVDQSQQQGYPAPIPVRAANPSTYPLHYNLISALHASDPSSALVSPVPASLHESYPFDYYSRGTTAYSAYGSDDGAASPTPSSASSGRSGEFAHQGMTQAQRDLAPLHSLKRHHPYRRDPEDDKTLRLLDPRPVPSAP
ncbi:hypothetical protein BDP27DRAFT_1335212 [Rhodocollybia butyracea]|uniref:Uncharacterized protein n=1 Tax=Rhodocollybia butyracea TaxID=206335 RepID=A0A9P5U2G2_9AGAR|nr:hypothetical protein BDP27DRAFT_1335212 [Rhodocollybia butyracea]